MIGEAVETEDITAQHIPGPNGGAAAIEEAVMIVGNSIRVSRHRQPSGTPTPLPFDFVTNGHNAGVPKRCFLGQGVWFIVYLLSYDIPA